jgi:hypothetical protein
MFEVADVVAAISFAAQQGVEVSTKTTDLDGQPTWAVLDTAGRFGFDIEVKAAKPAPDEIEG